MDAILTPLLTTGNPYLILVGVVGLFLLQKAGGEKFDLSGLLARLLGRKTDPAKPAVPAVPANDDGPLVDAVKALIARILAKRREAIEAFTLLKDAGIVVDDAAVAEAAKK